MQTIGRRVWLIFNERFSQCLIYYAHHKGEEMGSEG